MVTEIAATTASVVLTGAIVAVRTSAQGQIFISLFIYSLIKHPPVDESIGLGRKRETKCGITYMRREKPVN